MAMNAENGLFGLSPSVLRQLQECFARYPKVERVQIFGSRARSSHNPGSDIDLAVFAPELTEQEFAQLWSDIDALPIAFRMDLVLFDDTINHQLKDQILRDGITLYEREKAA